MSIGLSLRGEKGDRGDTGPAGQNAVAVSDAIRGQPDRFYREVGTILVPASGSFATRNDAVARPQNVDAVTTDSSGIRVQHDEIGARKLVGTPSADVDDNLRAVGISAATRVSSDLTSTLITLTQNRALEDTFTNPGGGAAFTKERGIASPFTLSGLTNLSADFTAYTEGLANVAAAWRMEEASGATLDDAIGANDGTVVGTVTYGVTGGMPSAPSDKAITTPGTASNELTLPLAGITQAAFSVIVRAKFPVGASVIMRDATSNSNNGYLFGSDGAGTPHLFYRNGTNGAGDQFITSVLWSSVADGNWHTFGWKKNGAATGFYVDGVLVHSQASGVGSTAMAGPWHVGRNGTTTPYSQVTVSAVVTYSRALTDAEMLNAHNAAVADGLLHVTHADVGSTKTSEIRLTPMGALRPVLVPGSVTATGFNIKFLNSAGTQILVGDSEMVLGVSRDVRDVPINPLAISVPIVVQRRAAFATSLPALEPVLWARLGESSGTSFNDEIGTNDGTKSSTGVSFGATSFIFSDANTGVTLDGAQGKIAFGNPGLTGPFSILIFFKITGAGSVGSTAYSTIMGWGGASGSQRIMVERSGHGLYCETGGAILTTAAGTVPDNVQHCLIYTWDGTTQKAFLNGEDLALSVTANVQLNKAFWLGAYADTTTAYAGKGDWDELALFDFALSLSEKQQIWADATNGTLLAERAADVQISFRGLFETDAPPASTPEDTNAVPTATALPANDIGGAAAGYVSLAPYRASLAVLGPTASWGHRALPDSQGARDAIELNGLPGLPLATSTAWKNYLCASWGFDPVTGASLGNGAQGNPSLYMRVAGEFVYVVPSTQPLRMPLDRDTTVSGWATQINGYYQSKGGIPVPADAMPHFTGDRVAFIYQPDHADGQKSFYLYGFLPQSFEQATTQMELTSTPSSGGFFLEFDYQDPVNQQRQTFFCQSPVLYNDSAATIEAKMNTAKTASGVQFAFQSNVNRNFADAVACTGGPLNVAPVLCSFQLGQALQPVTFRYTNNFLNAGGVEFTYANSDAWTWTFLSSVNDPTIANATHHLPYMNVPDNGGSNVPGTASATHIDWMPLLIDWDEYNTAYEIGIDEGWDAPGTDLGHIVAMSIGNCGLGHVYPATGGDGTLSNTDGTKYMEGGLMTFRLDASAAGIDPVMMPLFNTIQRYGMMAFDKTGGGAEPVFRNWTWPGVTRPFPGPSNFVFNSQQYTAYMRQLSWESLQFIDPAAMLAGW